MAYITKITHHTNSKFKTCSKKSKLQLEFIRHTISHRSCLFIQPDVQTEKIVEIAAENIIRKWRSVGARPWQCVMHE